jgi:NAD(P)-dependent dehydrogenase (short-subunit alcohol dehydrogenase family)
MHGPLLADKVVLVSGSTQGLGAGIARRAAAEGAAGVAVTGRNADPGERLAAELEKFGVRRPALPGTLRRGEGRACRRDPQSRPRAPLGQDQDQWPGHRLDGHGGRKRNPAEFHGAGDDWLEKANTSVPMGKLGQVDEIAEFVAPLQPERSGHRLGH